MEILVEYDADINKFSNTGYYPIHIAALNNHEKIIEYLVDKNIHRQNIADLESGTDKQCSPLHLAAKKGNIRAILTILDLGGNIYAQDVRKWTALHYSAFNGHANAVNELCKYNSDFEKLRKMVNS